jgi:hypothetical protein
VRVAARPSLAITWDRWRRPALLVIIGSLAVLTVLRAISYASQPDAVLALITNADHRIYMDAAQRIRTGGPLYPAFQLAGPYDMSLRPELYPPPTLLFLVVPMSYLPDVLWWVLPLAMIAASVCYWRPSMLGWSAILACLAPPWAWDGVLVGGLFIYVAAFVALGTRWPAFFAGVLLKPSLFPFALLGVKSRWWWVAIASSAAMSLAMLPAWGDYLRALSNLTEGGLLYSVHNVPLVLIPLIARVSGRRRDQAVRL